VNVVNPRWPVVFFDLDGTLIDSIDLITKSYQHAAQTVLGHGLDPAEIRSQIGQPLSRVFQKLNPGKAEAMFNEYTRWNHDHTAELLTGFAGVDHLLAALDQAAIRYGIVTSKRRGPGNWGLELTGLTDVPIVIAQEDTPEHKPSPRPLLMACEEYKVDPASIAYVGDAVVDIQAAHNAGATAIAVTWGAGTKQDLEAAHPEFLCETVEELETVLLGTSN
jgi:pyrophosphatase PpaX